MNFWETLLIGLIEAGEEIGSIFVHSKNGVAVLNASEPFVNAALTAVVAQATTAAATTAAAAQPAPASNASTSFSTPIPAQTAPAIHTV